MANKNILSINEAREQQASYRPNSETAANLLEVNALLFVGAACVGKSTTLDLVANQDDRFSRTGSIGSRPVEPRDDPKRFQHFSKETLLEKITDGSVVQYAIHPTSGQIYATTADMYASPFNMLEMLPSGIDQFRRLGFGGLQAFYMVTQPEAWRQVFEARYPDPTAERQKRLGEAILSLEWSLDQPEDSFLWLHNIANKQETTAKQIIHTATTGESAGVYRDFAMGMLNIAKKL